MKFLLISLLIAPALLAQPGPGRGFHRGGGNGPGCGSMCGAGAWNGCRGLNLTADQQAQAKAIHARHQDALKAKGDAVRQARMELREAMHKADTPQSTLLQLQEKASKAQGALMLEHRALRLEMDGILTPEQKAQRDARFEQIKTRREGMRQRRNPDCPAAPRP